MSDNDLPPIANSQELATKFLALKNPTQLARLLGIKKSLLLDIVLETSGYPSYSEFFIPKKAGGERRILAPNDDLKEVQTKLNRILQAVYYPRRKPSAHGFLPDRSILTNASLHKARKHVLNVDLQDFFPSITFNRVSGMFKGKTYELPEEVAKLLANICCYENTLPQGAPTSPIISNMICAQMDSQLQRLAMRNRCIYSRYADDMTFSTYTTNFPVAIASIGADSKVRVGTELKQVIVSNGFAVNPAKVRLQTAPWRQAVTGLIVNEFPNVYRDDVRELRAMLHNWSKQGYTAAQNEFCRRYRRRAERNPRLFAQVVKGRIDFIGMVKGKDNPIYIRYLKQLADLDHALPSREKILEELVKATRQREVKAKVGGVAGEPRPDPGSTEWLIAGLESLERILKDRFKQAGDAPSADQITQPGKPTLHQQWAGHLTVFSTLEARLRGNIHNEKYGDTETLRAEKAKIIDELNRFALEVLVVSFNDLADGELPA